jgi:hypothetical protein
VNGCVKFAVERADRKTSERARVNLCSPRLGADFGSRLRDSPGAITTMRRRTSGARTASRAYCLFQRCVCLLGGIALWTGQTQRLVVDPRNPMRDPRHGLVQLSRGRMAKYDVDEVRVNVASCRPPVLVFEAVRKHPHPSVCRFAQRRQFEPCKQGFQPSVLKSYSECFIHVEP